MCMLEDPVLAVRMHDGKQRTVVPHFMWGPWDLRSKLNISCTCSIDNCQLLTFLMSLDHLTIMCNFHRMVDA